MIQKCVFTTFLMFDEQNYLRTLISQSRDKTLHFSAVSPIAH